MKVVETLRVGSILYAAIFLLKMSRKSCTIFGTKIITYFLFQLYCIRNNSLIAKAPLVVCEKNNNKQAFSSFSAH